MADLILEPPTEEWQATWLLYDVAGSTLVLGVESSCVQISRLEVAESSDVVNVTALVREDNEDGCWPAYSYEEATVRLDAPLGDRTLTGCLPDQRPVGESQDDCGVIESD